MRELDDKIRKLSSIDKARIHFGMGEIIDNHVVDKINALGLVDTGSFKNSIRHDEYDETHVLIYSDKNYAPHLEYGTRPHVIRPKTKKALFWEGAEHPVKVVHHPGTKEYAPFRKGLLGSQSEVVEYVKNKIIEYAK